MSTGANVWDKLTRLVIFLFFIAYLLAVAIWYFPLIQANERYRKELLRQDARIQKQELMGKQLHAAIDALNRDPKAIGRLARERLGYSKAGETVIRFEAPNTNTNTVPHP
jgi:cell division protein FtsB